jgi:hypothetical protein
LFMGKCCRGGHRRRRGPMPVANISVKKGTVRAAPFFLQCLDPRQFVAAAAVVAVAGALQAAIRPEQTTNTRITDKSLN